VRRPSPERPALHALPEADTMNTMTPTERAVREVRQAAFELNATDQKQAVRMLKEALKLQPGHADLLGDLAALHLQAGRHRQCIQAAGEALAANPLHDDSAFAMALALDAVGETARARELFVELTEGSRAERFAAQPELVELCRAKLNQYGPAPAAPAAPAAASLPAPAAAAPAPMPTLAPELPLPAAPAERSDTVYAPLLARPDTLGQLLQETEGVQVLTLDCFDTILWRHTELPTDVFFDMARRPAFRAAGIDATMRQRGEQFARQLQFVRTGRTEVGLEQIYQASRPGLSREMLAWLAEDELAAEMQACHALPGAVRLLREARARAIPVTIVSDTYFDAAQLRRLLEHTLPADAFAAIGEVLVSSEHGMCKKQGLFKLAQLNRHGNSPAALHVGDNKDADFKAPRALGISATHLLHEGDLGMQRRRLSSAVMTLLDPTVRATRPLYAPYRPVHATHGHRNKSPEAAIGHDALGPVMHAFAAWLDQEAASISATRGRVKFVFLMRDAHLPLLTYRAIGGRTEACAAHISRFSAYAASFRSQEQVDQYLAHFGRGLSLPMLARQLLLSPERTRQLLDQAAGSANPLQTFLAGVRQGHVLAEIQAASATFRQNLRRYLERETGMSPGDTLVFVDLGYAGTIQRVLSPVLQEWQVETLGRYLLATGSVDDSFRGLLDRSWLDERALKLVQVYIGLLETLCTADGASVAGYDAEGRVLLEEAAAQDAQSASVEPIQAESLRFAREAQAYFQATRQAPAAEQLRDEALGSLGRLLFFPNAAELAHLESFQLEINLGSGIARKLFDLEAGLDGLRRHGLFYLRSADSSGGRMALPAELRCAGLELSTTLLSTVRYGLPMHHDDWATRQEPLLAVIQRADRTMNAEIVATPTHDGFFRALVPMPQDEAGVGLAFGRDYEWIQLHSADIVPLQAEQDAVDVRGELLMGGVVEHAGGLLQFEASDSLLMLPADYRPVAGKAALNLVFRPIARRGAPA